MSQKILVVDDEPEVLQMLKIRLEAEGFQVTTAGDGMDAINKVKADKPDLIILDVAIPKLSGYQVCANLRKHPSYSRIPIIMLSVKSGFKDVSYGMSVGASDYITKPFEASDLLQRIKKFITGGPKGQQSVAISGAKKVLFADSGQSHIEAMSLGIERHNFVRTHDKMDLLVARDGVDALEKTRLEMPSLAVLNARLPKLDGLELCRKLKGDLKLKAIPVLIFSENPHEGEEALAKALGAAHYYSGVFKPEEIIRLATELVYPKV